MARILLVLALFAVTIYAVADWIARSRTWTPGRVNRWVWLAVIILLPAIGPLAWIITGLVTRAEQRQNPTREVPEPPKSLRPDDDPDAISDLVERFARREKRTRPPKKKGGTPPAAKNAPKDKPRNKADSVDSKDETGEDDPSLKESKRKAESPSDRATESDENEPGAGPAKR